MSPAILQETKGARIEVVVEPNLWQPIDRIGTNLLVPHRLYDNFFGGIIVIWPKRMHKHALDFSIPTYYNIRFVKTNYVL